MSEIRRRKIYAGYYDRYDRKPFYVVCEATDYDIGEVNVIMQEYSLVNTKEYAPEKPLGMDRQYRRRHS